MDMDDALQTFISESRELLETMENYLLNIDFSADNTEIIHAIFRTAHTIKGSSGMFGLHYIVSFTHVAESVLDRVRNGEVVLDADLITLLLTTADYIGSLIDHVADGGDEPVAELSAEAARIITLLNHYLEEKHGAVTAQKTQHVSANGNPSIERLYEHSTDRDHLVHADFWHISLRFNADIFRNGMDAISFIQFLTTLGDIHRVVTITNAIPEYENFDPESCYLGFEISLKSAAQKAEIEAVFDFVREGSNIKIFPPHSKIEEYVNLIGDLPEEELRLGDILVRCGTLTESELNTILTLQAKASTKDAQATQPIGEMLVAAQLVQQPVMDAALEKQSKVKTTKAQEATLIRVDPTKLDELINLVGELIIAGSGANLVAQDAKNTEFLEAALNISKLIEQVRDSALSLRMVQIGATFNRFGRVVREVSHALNKEIQLVINGENTELDKTVVEKISDPLIHLVRNAIDHGIESAEVRAAMGKPVKGTLSLNAYHESGSIVIEVKDDGGGLNKAKILSKAIERGLITAEQQLTDKEIYNLIFEAGFSTKDAVNDLSGRGVGMDVVKRNIQALRGTVDIDSTTGKGSAIRIRLPLTLAIIDGFLVTVGGASYVIPLEMVQECIELNGENMVYGKNSYVDLRGEVLPFTRLREHFEVQGAVPLRENIVVVHYGETKAGLVVDALKGEFQAVIKPLGKLFSHVQGIAGFTILGNGEVALILDIPELMQQVTQLDKNNVLHKEVSHA